MIKPKEKTPELTLDLVNGTNWKLSEQTPENFTMLIFYRGIHCPVCKQQLEELQSKLKKFVDRGVNVIAISGDTEEKAKKAHQKWNIKDIPLGYNLSMEEARKWGLYISSGIKDPEPKQFSEPGLFLVRPDQSLYCVALQSMPFARPPFDELLEAIDFVLENEYPARGEA